MPPIRVNEPQVVDCCQISSQALADDRGRISSRKRIVFGKFCAICRALESQFTLPRFSKCAEVKSFHHVDRITGGLNRASEAAELNVEKSYSKMVNFIFARLGLYVVMAFY